MLWAICQSIPCFEDIGTEAGLLKQIVVAVSVSLILSDFFALQTLRACSFEDEVCLKSLCTVLYLVFKCYGWFAVIECLLLVGQKQEKVCQI